MAAFYKIYGQTVPTLQTGDALEKVIINEVQEVDAVRICQEKQSISLGTSMGQTQKWADFHLVMNGQTWKASRAIICPQSRVFMKFCNEPKNVSSSDCKVSDTFAMMMLMTCSATNPW